MKKIVSLLCSFAMLFTLCASAFAVDVETTAEPADVAVMSISDDDGGIAPQAESRGLYYVKDAFLPVATQSLWDWVTIKVTPDKGAYLRMWLQLDSGNMRVKVNNGAIRTYNSSPSSDPILVSNCDGGTYEVKIQSTTSPGAFYSMLLYQN